MMVVEIWSQSKLFQSLVPWRQDLTDYKLKFENGRLLACSKKVETPAVVLEVFGFMGFFAILHSFGMQGKNSCQGLVFVLITLI